MSATKVTVSWRKHNRTPSRLFVRSGPESSTLFRDVPLVSAAESETTRILSGFWGWYTPKWGRHQPGVEGLNSVFSTECSAIPDSREEIPTPAVARAHPHLEAITEKIPELDPEAEILLLVGRDAPPLHKVHESRNRCRNAPWAQRLDLGWMVLGNVCMDGAHKPTEVSSYRTQVLDKGQPSFLLPCSNRLYVKHGSHADSTTYLETSKKKGTFFKGSFEDGLGDNIFACTKDDNRPGMSVEDRKFIHIMNSSLARNESGSWEAPLPVRKEFNRLPNNREDAVEHLKSTRQTLDKRPLMKQHYFDFMQKLLEKGQAEPVRMGSM